MSNVNTVAISGNVTRDPEFKQINADFAVAKFGVAVNRRVKDATSDDGYGEAVSFFDVEVLGSFASLVGRKLKKGDSVTVTGRLEQQRWETAEGNRSKVVIIANEADSEAFFRAKDLDNALDAGAPAGPEPTAAPVATPAQAAQVAAAVATDDDIPF